METFVKLSAAVVFFAAWIIGFLASMSVSIFILVGAFSVIQLLFGVDQDATLLYEILSGLGFL